MTTSDFTGQGDALLTEPLRAFRSWTAKIELRDVRNPRPRRPRTDYASFADWLDEIIESHDGRSIDADGRRRYEFEEARRRGQPGYQDGFPADTTGKLMIPGTPDELTKMTLLPVSQGSSGPWQRERVAICIGGSSHQVPQETCSCGIYSWYRPEEARAEHTGVLTGVISVLGRAILGDRGIRSARARIEAVTINEAMSHLLPFPRAIILEGLRQEANRKGGPYEGMVVCDSQAELRKAYPPDLDTVANLLGEDVVYDLVYGGRPLAGFTHRAFSAHLVAGSTARRWTKTITGRFRPGGILPPNAPPADPTRDDQEDQTP